MTQRCSVLLGLGLCGFIFAAASRAERGDFQWQRVLEAGDRTQDEILDVVLDGHIYRNTRIDYADLRVVDATSAQVPYLLEKVTSNDFLRAIHEVSMEVDGIEKPTDNRLVFFLSMTDTNPVPVYGVYFDTPLKDFEREVSIFGRTGQGWVALVTNALIYDYSRFIDLRETRISIPPGYYPSLRVEVDQVTDERESALVEMEKTFQGREEIQRTDRTSVEKRPFRISRINLWTEERREVVRVVCKADYPVASFSSDVDAGKKRTVVLVKTGGEPLTDLAIEAPGQNFNRQAEVQVPVFNGMQQEWRTVSAGVISQISFREFKHTRSTLSFSEQRAGEYRIVVENQDNPPLQVSGVKASGNMYRMLFLASADVDYALAYGNEGAVKPQYDAGAILGALRGGYAPRLVELGEPVQNKQYRGGGGYGFFNSKLFFGLVIGLLVLTLASAIMRASKKIEPEEKEKKE